ncbi:MAG: sugar phosphate isomerase/epimerase [Clostridia bacterium]|nr:sugar phosphate isomerase/epimerase [Clostridia bacterium]
MLLICPVHTPEFLEKYSLGVEAHIGRYDKLPNWEQYISFTHGVHLPYAGLNLAAIDDNLRLRSIEATKIAIDMGCRYPVGKMVMHTMGIESLDGEPLGTYERLIEGIRELAEYASSKKITLCIENQAQHVPHRVIYGVTAEEWYRIQEDVNRKNVMLTLDTSHAACAAALLVGAEVRFSYMYEFLKHPERIGRVHWSDSRLTYAEAYYKDMHLIPGEGDLPIDFHRKIKSLDAIKTLEQKRPEEDVIKGLEFINSL